MRERHWAIPRHKEFWIQEVSRWLETPGSWEVRVGLGLWCSLVPEHVQNGGFFYLNRPGPSPIRLKLEKDALPWEWFLVPVPERTYQRIQPRLDLYLEDWQRIWPGGWVAQSLQQQRWTMELVGKYCLNPQWFLTSGWNDLMSPLHWTLMAARLATLATREDEKLHGWVAGGEQLVLHEAKPDLWQYVQRTPIGRDAEEAIYFLGALREARRSAGNWRKILNDCSDYAWRISHEDQPRTFRGLMPGTVIDV